MKKYIAGFIILTFLGAISWGAAQGTKTELFDITKAQQEMEIMKGILSTTLSFVSQSLQKPQGGTGGRGTVVVGGFGSSWRYSSMNAFYLYGQGAVFVIPTSGLRLVGSTGRNLFVGDSAALSAEFARSARELEVQAAAMAKNMAAAAAAPAATAKSGQQPQPAQPPQVNQEELRKKVADAQERVKKSREDAEANRAKFLAALAQIKVYLIEALANHGDSLTTVKPSEYLTLVISTDDYDGFLLADDSGPRTHREIISVQKSWITDYKAGRLTLDAFKQKALQYSE